MGTQPYSAEAPRASGDGPTLRQRLIATALLVALLALFVWAGFWQLDRAEFKEQKQIAALAASEAAPLTQLVADNEADALRFRTFRLRGQYLPERQILLDNMTAAGQNGYHVLTVFKTGSRQVLVNRGWVKANADRRILPLIDVDARPRIISARLEHFPAPGIKFAQLQNSGTEWPRRLLFPTRDTLATVLDSPLPDYQLLLNDDQADGYSRDWQLGAEGPEQHLGYAAQWFSFAGLALIFYFILNVRWKRAAKQPDSLKNDTT